MPWRNTSHKLVRQRQHRQAIASKMPQTKAEARKACFEAAQQHRITKLPDGKPIVTKRGNRINHKAFEAMR